MRKRKTDVALWARVPYSDVEAIERALPRYGWRAGIMRHVVAYLAYRLEPGSEPSMHTMKCLAEEAADQYAHGEAEKYASDASG